jgi:hypothetical protein
MSVKSPTNILLHNSATVIVLSTGRIFHRTICLERNCTLKMTRTVFSLVAMLNSYFRFRLISHSNVCQTRPRHRHTWKLKFGGNFESFFLQKYGAATIFFLYGNKNVPSAKILRGRRCLRTRTFILFGLTVCHFCLFSFGYCIFCSSSNKVFWLSLWYLQTFLMLYL